MNQTKLTNEYVSGWRYWSDRHHPADFEIGVIQDFWGEPLVDKKVLEVGCGDGRVLTKLASHCREIVGIDTNSRLTDSLQSAQTALPANASVHNMSGTDLHFAYGSFDLVIFPWCLHQFPDPEQAFSEARRVLKPQGRVIVFGLTPGGPYEIVAEKLNLYPGPQVNPVDAYEKPLKKVFGAIKATKTVGWENDDLRFGFRFADFDEALKAWRWALLHWHDHDPTESDIEILREALNEYKIGEQLFMPTCGILYFV